ncbi:MazG family protein [Cellulomonas fimi]|uniref:MazG family protein n=1 Tax=Cellulomonas fimi (strain ATCC 484 / DSM 20113 / JCM 1341 / CCUG 24087 / LMG 16345 / NBRC 15513 / NCIMB 8980 / NCTC 7547 / NRS-133) TaxID=590998 RepID=F4GYM8_CELFA|nr:MazG family protein [Cellulomonas fimi]AEE47145.1 MazG family protein [Cellulomonas fimi ATCC 484]VEH35395.1 Nucleoside triphosphate pyrophosphohydrolase [Cellulomonas fimi]
MDREAAPGGDALSELVAVMDRLRSPGGCPWDAQQTHLSLVPYLLEEAAELAEAIEDDDRAGLREELGDVLLQVVFHARLAQEHPDDPFDVQGVAADLVAKLVRRHPHVFADASAAADEEGQHAAWDRLKRAEKDRASAFDGVPRGLGALARAQKLVARAERSGAVGDVPREDGDGLGERLFALVLEARRSGLDAEGELRRVTAAWEARQRAAGV